MDERFDPWPLWGLVLRTPRLELRPDDDQGVAELMAVARAGIHPPTEMPFNQPWTDAPAEEMARDAFRHHWRQRATSTPDMWWINFLVRRDGELIGTQGLYAQRFAVTREVSSGSWLGIRHQGDGLGTEMRAAVLMLAFDHLGARTARSSAFTDNHRSAAVSRRLGYQPDGTLILVRRGAPATQTRQLLTADRFAEHRPPWRLEVTGLDAVLPTLGL